MINAIDDPVFVANEHGVITHSNKAAQDVLKINLPDTGREDLISVGYNQDGQIEHVPVLSYDGATYAIKRTTIQDKGKFLGTINIWKDITNQKLLECELQQVKQDYSDIDAAMQASYDGIFITDGQGTVLKYNEAYNRITGIDASEFLGRKVEDVIKKYHTESAVMKVIETGDAATTMPDFRSGKKALITANPVFNEHGEIFRVISNVRDITELITLNSQLEQARELTEKYYSEILQLRSQQADIEGFIVSSESMKNIVSTALKVAHTNATVTITGESGVGKEVLARAIHNNSELKSGPFVKINCGAIPDNLLESELFGYEKGAFTGAAKTGKLGLLEVASGGTIFLDEISELPMNLQVKLLGVLQDFQFTRIGGIKTIRLNARVIAATNKRLEDMVTEKKFRKDLYYRLNVVSLVIPPLMERQEDILPFARHFLDKFNRKYKVHNTLSLQVLSAFQEYDWPGNVREMENLIERMVILSQNAQITLDLLPDAIKAKAVTEDVEDGVTYSEIINRVEYKLFRSLLEKGHSTRRIAKELGISQPTVVRKINRLKLNADFT